MHGRGRNSSPKYHKERNGSNSMITKQTTEYSALFEKASKDLGITDPKQYITTLNEYFANITELVTKTEKGLQYTILPLDEETFDIDANTREITIPKSFKDGVGVQGDQVAEIIYFTIDRYFDATDLNTQNIYIEWRNASGDEGLSKEYVRDLTTLPNKIIFGWPLQAEITESAGPVEFAVRFYTLKDEGDKKEIVYSFATKPARIIINKTMGLDITKAGAGVDAYDATEMIINRFQNSQITDENLAVDAPTFLLDLIAGKDYDISDPDSYDDFVESYTLRVSAYGTGYVSYSVQTAPCGGAWEQPSALDETYILTTDAEKVNHKIYYKQVETDGVVGYEIYDGDLPLPEKNTTIYERVGEYKVETAGEYRLIATNRQGAKWADKPSNTVVFPMPEMPVVNRDKNPFPVILQPATDEGGNAINAADLTVALIGDAPKGTLTYSWKATKSGETTIPGADKATYRVIDNEDVYWATVTNNRNKRSASAPKVGFRVSYPAEKPVIISALDSSAYVGETIDLMLDMSVKRKDYYVVEWYEAADPRNGINPGNDGNPVATVTPGNDGIATYVPQSDGVFYALIQSIYNGDRSEKIVSTPCQVYNN